MRNDTRRLTRWRTAALRTIVAMLLGLGLNTALMAQDKPALAPPADSPQAKWTSCYGSYKRFALQERVRGTSPALRKWAADCEPAKHRAARMHLLAKARAQMYAEKLAEFRKLDLAALRERDQACKDAIQQDRSDKPLRSRAAPGLHGECRAARDALRARR